MAILYNLTIFFLRASLRVAGIFHGKAKAFVTGRNDIFRKLAEAPDRTGRPVVWIHCASLGEFEQGRPIMEAIRKEFPKAFIALTFFSPSGYDIRKNYPVADLVTYLPYDTAGNARRFVATLAPKLAVFVKYEFWPHFSRELRKQNIPLISSSSIFRRGQLFFHPLGGFYRNTLRNFSHFFVQNHESVSLLKSIGIREVTFSGDTRFDRVNEIVQRNEGIDIARAFKADQRVMVVGSSWQEDLDVLVPFINENRLKFIIAPHEISESGITTLEKALQVRSIRYSHAAGKNLEEYAVLIVDNIGLLSGLYRYGEFAYVGGGFGKGLHNILEAACYGVPILFGNKNFEKFQEAVDLINRGGAFEVHDYPDLKEKYEMLNIPASFMLACEVTRQYVDENLGATERIMRYCRNVLSSPSQNGK